MKKTLLITMIGLTAACNVFAQEQAALSISGPSSWARGTKVTVAVQDKYFNLGGSSVKAVLLSHERAAFPLV